MCQLLGFEGYIAQCIITGLENNYYYSPKCGTAQIALYRHMREYMLYNNKYKDDSIRLKIMITHREDHILLQSARITRNICFIILVMVK